MLATTYSFFFFNDTATTEIYTLSLHDALPIWPGERIREKVLSEQLGGSRTPIREALLKLQMAGVVVCNSRRRSEEHTSELQSRLHLVCRLLLEKKKTVLHSESSRSFSA